MSDECQIVTIRSFPSALFRQLKAAAATRGLTIAQVIAEQFNEKTVASAKTPKAIGRATERLTQCSSCGHPVSQHKPAKGSANLFCQAASCTCRLTGGGR